MSVAGDGDVGELNELLIVQSPFPAYEKQAEAGDALCGCGYVLYEDAESHGNIYGYLESTAALT